MTPGGIIDLGLEQSFSVACLWLGYWFPLLVTSIPSMRSTLHWPPAFSKRLQAVRGFHNMGKPRLSSGEQVRVRDKKGPLFFLFLEGILNSCLEMQSMGLWWFYSLLRPKNTWLAVEFKPSLYLQGQLLGLPSEHCRCQALPSGAALCHPLCCHCNYWAAAMWQKQYIHKWVWHENDANWGFSPLP